MVPSCVLWTTRDWPLGQPQLVVALSPGKFTVLLPVQTACASVVVGVLTVNVEPVPSSVPLLRATNSGADAFGVLSVLPTLLPDESLVVIASESLSL